MVTFNQVLVGSSSRITSGWMDGRHLARVAGASGRMWTIHPDLTGQYYYANYSDDQGATWSADETVYDVGSGGATYQASIIIANDGLPRVAILSASSIVRFFKRSGGGVWSAGSTVTVDGDQTQLAFMQSPDNCFHLIYTAQTGGNDQIRHQRSNSALGSWASVGSVDLNGTAGFQPEDHFGMYAVMDSAGNIHGAFSANVGGGNYGIIYRKWTYAADPGTGSWGSMETVVDNGAGAGLDHVANVDIALDSNGKVHITGSHKDASSFTGKYQLAYYTNASGSWSAKAYPYGAARDSDHWGNIQCAATFPIIILAGKAYGTNTSIYNIQYYTKESGSWVRTAVTDVTEDQFTQGFAYNPMSAGMMPLTGAAFSIWDSVSTDQQFFVGTSDVTWPTGVQVFNKTMSSTLRFESILSPQGWFIRSLAATSTAVPGGGRQTVRNAAGQIWHVYYDGAVKVAYSSDLGANWTHTTVGVSWLPDGMALCIGASDRPVLALCKPSNSDIYVYGWNGTSWSLKDQVPASAGESFQILYVNSVYHLIYGTTDRKIRTRTSSDLITWSAQTTIYTGASSGLAPSRYRRLAACEGLSNTIALMFSCPTAVGSPVHRLFYAFYTGAWSTPIDFTGSSTGSSLYNMQTGLSIAVDAGNIHLVWRGQDPTYTSRVKLFYWKFNALSFTPEVVSASVDADQDMPSLSLNGTNPVVCWRSPGQEFAVSRSRRNGGLWDEDGITDDTRDNCQSVHGPNYGANYWYSRGVFGTFHGSEESYQSSDLLNGTAAFLENTLNFESILSTLHRVMTQTINFVSSLVGVRSIGMTNTIHFSQRLNTTRSASMANVLEFRSVLNGSTATVVLIQTLHFNHSLAGVKSPQKTITQTINFESRLAQSKSFTFTQTLDFDDSLTSTIYKKKFITQTINFASVLGLHFTLKKPLIQVLNFFSNLFAMKGDEGCEPAFTPDRPIANPNDVNFVYFIGPVPAMTLAVQLKKPSYGNARRQSLQVRINRTRAGTLRVHAKVPTFEPQNMTFENCSYLKMEQMRNFLITTKGRQVYYLDERSRKWVGYITTGDIDLSDEDHDRGGSFTIDFEGKLV